MIALTRRGLYRFSMRFGLKAGLAAMDYYRFFEYPLVARELKATEGMVILDIGSRRSIFPLFLATRGCVVYATDIDEMVFDQINMASRAGLNHLIEDERFIAEKQDTRRLTYPDHYFHRVTAISTLEHITVDGDIEAMQEIGRVLCGGGQAVITLPFARRYSEIQPSSCQGAFTRQYDAEAINKRIVKPSGLKLVHRQYFGERDFKFNIYWAKFPYLLRIALHPLVPLFSYLFLSIVEEHDLEKAYDGICLTLRKE